MQDSTAKIQRSFRSVRLKRFRRGQHLIDMSRHFYLAPLCLQPSVGIDQKSRALYPFEFFAVHLFHFQHFILATDIAGFIAQQLKVQRLLALNFS